MKKIASPAELQTELRRLLAYSQSEKPSRAKLAAEMRKLADRVAADRVAGGVSAEGSVEIVKVNKLER